MNYLWICATVDENYIQFNIEVAHEKGENKAGHKNQGT